MSVDHTNLVRTSQRKKGTMKIREEEIIEFAEDHYDFNEQRVRWNGRQIRNAFHIAVALAENEAVERAATATATADGRAPRKPTLRARHFQVIDEASSKFDEYLTSVLGMAQAQRARQNSYRRDDWELRKDRKQQQERTAYRRRGKRYGGDETDSEDDDDDDHGAGGGGGGGDRLRSPQKKGSGRRDDDSDSLSEPPRRKKKGRSVNDTDGSEDEPTAREKKRDVDRKSSRDKDRGRRDRDRDRDIEQDHDYRYRK